MWRRRPGHASADYFGAFADRVRKLLKAERFDPPFVGDDVKRHQWRHQQRQLPRPRPAGAAVRNRSVGCRRRLAQEAVARRQSTVGYHDHAAAIARPTSSWACACRAPKTAERAEAIVGKAKGPDLKTVEEVYARETLLLSKYPKEVEATVRPCGSAHSDRGDPLRGVRGDRPGASRRRAPSSRRSRSSWPTATTATCRPRTARPGRLRDLAGGSSYLEVDAASKISEKAGSNCSVS